MAASGGALDKIMIQPHGPGLLQHGLNVSDPKLHSGPKHHDLVALVAEMEAVASILGKNEEAHS